MLVPVLELARVLVPQCHTGCPLTGPVLVVALFHRGLLGQARALRRALAALVRKGLLGSGLAWGPRSVVVWLSP